MAARGRRRIFIDVTPLRQSRDLRILLGGQLVSLLGNQLTLVAIPYQVYELTHSSLDVGLVSLAQLIPLLICSLYGGTVIDSTDRRRLLIRVEIVLALCSVGLAFNTDLGPRLWPLFVLPAIAAGLTGFDNPTRNAIVPRLVGTEHIATASAMVQVLNQVGIVVGPALGGLLLAGAGADFVYWFDAASFLVAIAAAWAISPQPPSGHATRPGLRAVAEGFRYIRQRQGIQGAYLIDINAMVFGMPRALFPAMAITVFHGGATAVGFLYAAPGVGALIGALITGWVARIRRQGLTVIVAVMVWGAAIVAFGLMRNLLLALLFLAVAGWADVISGGLACIAGALLLAWGLPGFRRVEVSAATAAAAEAEAEAATSG